MSRDGLKTGLLYLADRRGRHPFPGMLTMVKVCGQDDTLLCGFNGGIFEAFYGRVRDE